MFDEEGYRKLFVEESRENHENIVNNLLALESGDDQHTAIDEIFRSAHTLKGMSASMGFDAMEHLCHSMEDVFSLIRSGRREVTASLTDLLLTCTDAIEGMLDAIEAGEKPSDEQSTSLVQDLQAFAEEEEEGGEQETPDMAASAGVPPEQAEEADGRPLYTLAVAVDPSSTMKDIRAMLLLQNLEEIGTVRSTTPSRELLEDGKFDGAFEILIESEAGVDALRTIASGTEISLLALSTSQSPTVAPLAIPPVASEEVRAPEQAPSEPQIPPPQVQRAVKAEKSREIKNIRVDIQRLDRMMNLVEDLVINRGRLEQIAKKHGIKEFDEALSMVGRSVSDLQNLMMGIRMMPLERIFNRLPRVVRDVANHDGKEVEFSIEGGETELDRSMMDGLSDPLLHIIRNAVNHGIETPEIREAGGKPPKGSLRLTARRDKDNVVIDIEDDGAGIDTERLRKKGVEKGLMTAEAAASATKDELVGLLFEPGFSTAETITDISGRGVGLDVVKKTIESLKGSIKVETEVGRGTKFELVLPPTMAIIDVMMVHISGMRCAIPVSNVVEVAQTRPEAIHRIGNSEAILLRDQTLPMHRLEDMFGRAEKSDTLVVLQNDGRRCCIVVDSVDGQQEVVVKPLSRIAGNCRGISGITIPGDGDVVPVLDVNTMI
ncbi:MULTISPECIES: chemotaxis protein CheA [Methanoculleus]|uniref:Chemotaxis protein CheA n=2 Tax=Methanoculleus TaxID=45989 RepID=A3CU26_METMJ|nr:MULTISPECIES: chemotaxis protein CheA [Methanoculleus]ABN56876.1 CheA signal transduction histidine kinases [Methanoculleus marisnigri JR1]MCC7556733.1 chemotaxis protein CheA [Methanoculleus marisnigri]UYU18305.1 chemotaxis protein CheA [Methanoculleus submarinus]